MDYFDILGIDPTTNTRDIKKAYALLLKLYHPEEFPEEFKKINEAYKLALEYAETHKDDVDMQESSQFSDEYQEDKQSSFETIQNNNEEDFDSLYKELSHQFQHVEDYECIHTQKEKEIGYLIEMLYFQRENYGSPQKTYFQSPLFLQYYLDDMFIEEYTKAIKFGLYDNLNYLERKRIKKIHKKLYFSHFSKKKKYHNLYKEMYPYVFDNRGSMSEILFLIFLIALTIVLSQIKPFVFFIELILLSIYLVLSVEKSLKFKIYRKFMYVIFVFLLFISPFAHFEGSQTFGNYKTIIQEEVNFDMKQKGHQYFYFDNHYVKTNDRKVEQPHEFEELKDFVLFKDQFYYIYQNKLYKNDDQHFIMPLKDNSIFATFITNEKYCLLIEEVNQYTYVYNIEGNHCQQIYKGETSFMISKEKGMYLMDNCLYHYRENGDYLWCLDLKKKKDEESVISSVDLLILDGIEDYMFLGYRSHPHFLDGDYAFKGTVLKFVSLGDRYFGYVNDENMLYIVDYNQLEEVAGIDLMRDYSIEGSSINKISGDKNRIYVSADNDMTLLEICLEN